MAKHSEVLRVRNANTQKHLANIVLNGYNIQPVGKVGPKGALCSFKLTSGDLWASWSLQESLLLNNPATGREQTVRVAAYPVDDDSYGLIEFL